MTSTPKYPPGNPMNENEAALHFAGFVPATMLSEWKAGGSEVWE